MGIHGKGYSGHDYGGRLTQIVVVKFDAAHFVEGHPQCGVMHGHTWKVEVEVLVESSQFERTCMGMDFALLKGTVRAALPDHAVVNDVLDMAQATAENIAVWLFDRLHGYDDRVRSVTVWESETAGARYAL